METHRAHYGPLLTWQALELKSQDTSKDGQRCVVRTLLAGATSPLGTAVWTLSRHDDRWLIDAVLVQPAGEAATVEARRVHRRRRRRNLWKSRRPHQKNRRNENQWPSRSISRRRRDVLWRAHKSPRWVAKTVLSALRTIDEPEQNHGSGVA